MFGSCVFIPLELVIALYVSVIVVLLTMAVRRCLSGGVTLPGMVTLRAMITGVSMVDNVVAGAA